MVRFFPLQGLTLLSLTLFHIFVYFPHIRQLPRLPFKNLLTFVNPYVDAMVAIPFIERMIVILSLINSKSAAKKQIGGNNDEQANHNILRLCQLDM